MGGGARLLRCLMLFLINVILLFSASCAMMALITTKKTLNSSPRDSLIVGGVRLILCVMLLLINVILLFSASYDMAALTTMMKTLQSRPRDTFSG